MSGEYDVLIEESYAEVVDYTEQIVDISNKLDNLNNTVTFISWFVILIFIFNCILHKRGIF